MTPTNRRGLSPLIATVLLIAFAVALGTVIILLPGRGALPQTPTDPCEGVILAVYGGTQNVCYDTQAQHLKFVLRNRGTTPIDGIKLIVVDSQLNRKEEEFVRRLDPEDTFDQSYAYSTLSTEGIMVSFNPVIVDATGVPRTCPSPELSELRIRLC